MNTCLIDTKQDLGTNLLLVNSHPPAFSRNDIYRRRDADLLTYGLQKDDTDLVSEHLPHILDISRIHTVGIKEKIERDLPAKFELYPAYPNPFNPTTNIGYRLPTQSNVTLTVYNITGKKIKTLVRQNQNAGEHSVIFDPSGLASGVYIYKLQADLFEQSGKMLLLR